MHIIQIKAIDNIQVNAHLSGSKKIHQLKLQQQHWGKKVYKF